MITDEIRLAVDVGIPLLGAVGSFVQGLLSGAKQAKASLSELRGALAVAHERVASFDASFSARDASETARVQALDPSTR